MGIRSVLIALMGVAIAGGSAYATREYFVPVSANPAPQPQDNLISVIVAGVDIPYGHPLLPQSLQVISWPRDAVPPGAFTDMGLVVPQSGQPARRATRAIARGEIILSSKVSEFGEKVTIVQTLGPNARAMAIRVNAETAVGGFVTPGDTVDILLTQGRDAELRTNTILQNIRVIGVDQDANEDSDQTVVARTVTVEVTPDQGQIIALAQRAGTLSLSLRSLDGALDEALETVRLGDLLNEKPQTADAPASRQTVRVRRGNDVETVSLN